METNSINPEKVLNILRTTGFPLEHKIANYLDSRDWEVVQDVAIDSDSKLEQSVDIVASKRASKTEIGSIEFNIKLVIECKHSSKNVFVSFPAKETLFSELGEAFFVVGPGDWPGQKERETAEFGHKVHLELNRNFLKRPLIFGMRIGLKPVTIDSTGCKTQDGSAIPGQEKTRDDMSLKAKLQLLDYLSNEKNNYFERSELLDAFKRNRKLPGLIPFVNIYILVVVVDFPLYTYDNDNLVEVEWLVTENDYQRRSLHRVPIYFVKDSAFEKFEKEIDDRLSKNFERITSFGVKGSIPLIKIRKNH